MSEELLRLCEAVTLVDTDTYLNIIESLHSPIEELRTSEWKNIFHLLCSCDSKEDNLLKFVGITLNHIEKKNPEVFGQSVQKMLNSQTRTSKRTPVFEAVWFNKRKIVRKFIEFQPDLTGKDVDGQSLLHICTICGHLSLLAYFSLELQMSLEVFDNNQRTPLHVAALENKEGACAFLIAHSENLELRDKYGFTPLHLAAFTSNYRTIRHLIMKGASRKSRTPMYNALEIGKIMTISEDVLNLLKEPSCIEYLNPVSPPLSKVSNSRNTFNLNVLQFFVRYLIIVLFLYGKLPNFLIGMSAGFGFLSFVFLICSSVVDPGYVSKGKGLAELYILHKEEDICAYCSLFKEKSMKHCQRCNKCVKKFDHHCPWIHNCVGEGNHKFFYFYVLFTDLDFLFHTVMGVFVIATEIHGSGDNWLLPNNSENLVIAFSLFILSYCGLLFLALTPLLYVQTVNLITGLTTHDRFARQDNRIRDSRASALSIPFFESEQIPASLLDAGSSASSIVRELKPTCCCLSKAVSLIRDTGFEEMQRTSTIKD